MKLLKLEEKIQEVLEDYKALVKEEKGRSRHEKLEYIESRVSTWFKISFGLPL